MAQRRTFTKEFKEEAVALAQTAGRSQTDIAASLGIDITMLSRWKRKGQPKAEISKRFLEKAMPGTKN
jgi:transposase-like protein